MTILQSPLFSSLNQVVTVNLVITISSVSAAGGAEGVLRVKIWLKTSLTDITCGRLEGGHNVSAAMPSRHHDFGPHYQQ